MSNQKRESAATPEQVLELRGNCTQVQMAELVGVSLNTWQNWERGRSPIPKAAWYAVQSMVQREREIDEIIEYAFSEINKETK